MIKESSKESFLLCHIDQSELLKEKFIEYDSMGDRGTGQYSKDPFNSATDNSDIPLNLHNFSGHTPLTSCVKCTLNSDSRLIRIKITPFFV